MKLITLPQSFSDAIALPVAGKWVECAVEVDWFPHLTDDQIMTNALAHLNGQPEPYPDPNLISVRAPISLEALQHRFPTEKEPT